ncbi:DUF1176 domain-containing protein [Pseudoduganella sp. R-31]|uniref:DUF1176 domain-containing protein n=1 Tax=Pseudoduganella sp. R-31 TaxID=3404060 RepID=UPI003CEE91B4
MRLIFALAAALLPLCAHAFNPSGLYFEHDAWELACDNTGACRAAGYGGNLQKDQAASILLTRQAGPGQQVSGQVMLGHYDEREAIAHMPAKFKLELWINDTATGSLEFARETFVAELSQAQIAALLAALPQHATVELKRGDELWGEISDAGATAVLLKMDEYQGRVGTPGAVVRKGSRPESSVPPAVAKPKFLPAPTAMTQQADSRFVDRHRKNLVAALRTSVKPDDCEELFDDEMLYSLKAVRLTSNQMLVSMRCWIAAYNAGAGYWVVNDKPPFRPVLVTTTGSDYASGKISEMHKGRGLGDCWTYKTLRWNGKQFQLTAASTTGMCQAIAPDGTWHLPTVVTQE